MEVTNTDSKAFTIRTDPKKSGSDHSETQRWEKPGKVREVRFPKRQGRNGIILQ